VGVAALVAAASVLGISESGLYPFVEFRWVAGVLPAFIDIPASGTATYNGHAIGTVYNNGARYSAAGNYQQTWNFGTDSGNVSISNFDGLATITGSVTAGNRREFVGTLSNGAGVTGNINGSFFDKDVVSPNFVQQLRTGMYTF
jgi:hypothetical protein